MVDPHHVIVLSTQLCAMHGQFLTTTHSAVAYAWGLLIEGKLTDFDFMQVWHHFVDGGSGALDKPIWDFVFKCVGHSA